MWMSELSTSLVARTRRTGAALVRRAAEQSPTHVGPRAVQVRLQRVRLLAADRLRSGGDIDAARRAVTPLLGSADPLVRARALDVTGDRAGALAAARAARTGGTSGAVDPVEGALLHLSLLAGSDSPSERDDVLRDLVTVSPSTGRQASAVVAALGAQTPPPIAFAERYRPTLEAANTGRALAALDDLLDTWRLTKAYEESGGAFDAAAAAVPEARRARVTALALAEVEAWDRLGSIADSLDGAGIRAADLSRWADQALRAGYTTAALQLAQRALHENTLSPFAHRVKHNAQDQLDVIARRWQWAAVGTTPYTPNEHAVLSVLSQSLPIRSGGYATRSHGVLTGLAARGWEIEAVTRLGFPYDRWPLADGRTVPSHDVVDGITYHRLLEEGVRRYPQFPLAQYVGTMADGLERLARQQRTRLVHASSFHVTGLAAATAARRLGLPFIYEMRGLEDLMKGVGNPQFHTTERYRFLHHVETEVCHAADAVFVITDALRREMVRRGVPEEKLVVLPNGVHTDQFTPRERDPELEQLLRVEGLPVIGYAGSLVDYEGLELLMEAAAILAAQGVAFRVVVVGDGPAEASVQEAAYALALDDVVTFAGRVPHDDVPRYLSLFDITPFPRLPLPVCELISPMKPFEALAMGKAVVVSDVAALTEIITDEVTGLVFAKGDAADLARVLRRLIESPQLRSRVGTAGMNWVRAERDWSQVTATAADTYQQVLERHTQSREVRSAAP